MLETKSVHPYAIAFLKNSIAGWGRVKIILRTDQEVAIRSMAESLKKEREHETILEHSPRYSHASLGEAENANGRLQAQTRCLMAHVAFRYKDKVSASHKMLPWAVRHAGWLLHRFQVHANGMTSYRMLKGSNYRGEIVEFEETVWMRIPGRTGTDKLEPRWSVGIWVGKVESSDEHLIGTSTGITRTRSIMRKPEPERFDQSVYMSMVGRPWSISGGLADTVVTKKRKYITPKVVARHGPTTGCGACIGKGAAHPDYCRARFAEIFSKEEQANRGPLTPATTASAPRPEVGEAADAGGEPPSAASKAVPKTRVLPPTKAPPAGPPAEVGPQRMMCQSEHG